MSQVLVQYLREARATEAGLTQTLQVHIAATPPGEHRERLERHLETTRNHEQLIAARLGELEASDPLRQALDLVYAPVGYTLGIARGATRAMLSVIDLPRTLLLREPEPSAADRVLRNVRAETASSALELATYTAIERLAEADGDQKTARLAAQLRADEEEMAAYLRDAVVELSDRLAGPRARRTADSAQGTGDRAQRGNGTAPQPEAPPPTPETRHPAPEPPEPAEPAPPPHVSEEPELVAEFAESGAEDEAGAEVEIEEPWEGYDRMKAAEIEQRLADASDEVVAVVQLYEGAGKKRQTVLRTAERRLRLG
jgi:ferritin-like metal-binding protein YciE